MAQSFQPFPWRTRLVSRLIHIQARFTRPLTIGVRAMIFDSAGRILLVRHSYVAGWHFPGGAVEPGETLHQALERETREETNVELEGAPVLHGIFFNNRLSRRDHVVVYVLRAWRQSGPRPADWEIVETGFFDPAALPETTTEATRARLAEVLEGRPPEALW